MDSSTWIMTRSFQLKNSNSVIHKVKGQQQQQQQRLGLATAAAVATDDATVQVISAAGTTGRSRTSPVVMGEQAKKNRPDFVRFPGSIRMGDRLRRACQLGRWLVTSPANSASDDHLTTITVA